MDMTGAQSLLRGLNGSLLTAWSDELKVQTVHQDTGSPSSDAGGSTAVYDGGDSGQLQQRRQRSASQPAAANKGQLSQDTGSNFLSSSQLEADESESKASTSRAQWSLGDSPSLEIELEDKTNLEDKILRALEISSERNGRKFLPFNQMDNIFTYEAILKELHTNFPDWRPADLQNIAHKIYDVVELPDSSLTTRRKIFGTLVRINKAAWVIHFIDEGLCDSDLPFYFPNSNEQHAPVTRWTNDGLPVPIKCFTTPRWKPFERESFGQYQWEFQAPFFQVAPTDGQRKRPLHYRLAYNSILPFIEESEGEGMAAMVSGGYSEVWRVRIHPDNHSHPSSVNPYFAVKRLKSNTRTEEIFRQEVATLKRLSERNHAHLMRLELTYEYQDRFHLLFRWADGNLRDYWQMHPEPSEIPRTHAFAVWVSQQCLGLAEALMAIHECPPDSEVTANKETSALALQRTNGRHGDIKPENILWFNPQGPNSKPSRFEGRFVISDFGLTEFHRDETELVDASNISMSPTYSAPEYEVSKTLSPSFDIWSMGCVLLEFFVWYLKGYKAFDQFSRDRTAEDNTVPIKRDNYFKVLGNSRVNNGTVSAKAVLKKAVAREFQSLHQHPRISELLVDALDFIEKRMLRMGPEKRASSKEVVRKFREIYNKASSDAQYCLEPVPGQPKRVATDLSTLATDVLNVSGSDLLNPQSSQHVIPGEHHKSIQVFDTAAKLQSTDRHRIHSTLTNKEQQPWLQDLEVTGSQDVRTKRQLDHSPSTNRSSSRSTSRTSPKLSLPMDHTNEQSGKRRSLRQIFRWLLCW